MLLSIIIPHYNLPKELLKRCIESITALQIAPERYEAIIIDDGSATPPRWIKELFPQENIRLIENEHGCLGAARNTGISAAKGRYILFVDGDDTLQANNAIHQCLDQLEKENPDILRFKFKVRPSKQIPTENKLCKVSFGSTISGAVYMKQKNLSGCVWCYFIKKELLTKKEILFREGCYHEDEEFSTIAHHYAKTLIESDAQIYNYCIRHDSITGSNKQETVARRLADHLKAIENLCTFRANIYTQCNSIQKKALQRKITTLTVDHIVRLLHSGKSVSYIRAIIKQKFIPLMLYPIAPGNYGIKFQIFRLLANHSIGLYILRFIVPTKH
jgi:glycosyltransferase involved in cell wall biosynthesis